MDAQPDGEASLPRRVHARQWDTDKSVRSAVEAELERRKLESRPTEGGFHVKDRDGFEVQMGGKRQ